MNDDNPHNRFHHTNLVDQLEAHHLSPDLCNDMHGGVYSAVPGHPETPCPYPGPNKRNDPAQVQLVRQGDDFVKGAVGTIMASPAWRQGSAIFIVSDEGSYDNDGDHLKNDGRLSAKGCCDSPFLPPGYQFLGSDGNPDGNVWPGHLRGRERPRHRGHVRRAARGRQRTRLQPLLPASDDRGELGLGYLGNASDALQVQSMTELLKR